MKKELLNTMAEQFYQNPYEFQASMGHGQIALVKYKNQYALVIDKELNQTKKYRSYVDENGAPIGLPVFILFNSIKDIESLKKLDTIVDTSVYVNDTAQQKFEESKIISKGECRLESRYDTFILREIHLKQFTKNTVLVVRVDSHNPGTISKTTNEIPARTYFQLKEGFGDEVGFMLKGVALGSTIMMITFILISILTTGSSVIKESRRRKDLETKFKSIIKDGKDWKVYEVPDDGPNAFCIIMPNIFITDGLMNMCDEEELIAVMLHEAGHIKNFDSLKNLSVNMSIITTFLAAIIKLPSYAAFIAYILMLALMSSDKFQYIKSRWLGRPAEYRADSYATRYGYGDQLISALKKITSWSEKQSSKRPCGDVCQKWRKLQEHLDDHPELKDRVDSVLKDKETWQLSITFSFKKLKDFITTKLIGV